MDDQQVIERINEIAHEEHELWEREGRGEITAAEQEQLRERRHPRSVLGPASPASGTSGRRARPR